MKFSTLFILFITALVPLTGCKGPNKEGFTTENYMYIGQIRFIPGVREACESKSGPIEITMKNRHCPQNSPNSNCTYDTVPSKCEDFDLEIVGMEVTKDYDPYKKNQTANIVRTVPGEFDPETCTVTLEEPIAAPYDGQAFIAIGRVTFKGDRVMRDGGASWLSDINRVDMRAYCDN